MYIAILKYVYIILKSLSAALGMKGKFISSEMSFGGYSL